MTQAERMSLAADSIAERFSLSSDQTHLLTSFSGGKTLSNDIHKESRELGHSCLSRVCDNVTY